MIIRIIFFYVLMLGAVSAQSVYPDKPISLIQGFGAGGNSDTIARIIAPGLSRELGQQVIVDAKTGAGGNIASAAVAKAPPDGYTLILFTGGHAVSAAVYNKLPFHPHVPYKGGAGPLQDLIGGRVDVMFDSITVTKGQMEAGKLRALGVTSLKPYKLLPGVPPVADTIPGYEVTSWTGLAAPKGTSPEVLKRLHTAILKVLSDPEVIAKLENTGGLVTPSSSSAQMKQYVSNQTAKWRRVVALAGIPKQ